jgi:hypothetical protein
MISSIFINSRILNQENDISGKIDPEMISKTFIKKECKEKIVNSLEMFAIGFTITNAGGNDPRALVDRDQDVTRFISRMSSMFGYLMSYVGDDPELYGLTRSPPKRDGSTQTTWVIMTKKN